MLQDPQRLVQTRSTSHTPTPTPQTLPPSFSPNHSIICFMEKTKTIPVGALLLSLFCCLKCLAYFETLCSSCFRRNIPPPCQGFPPLPILFLTMSVAPFLFSIVIKMSSLWPRCSFKSSFYLHSSISWKVRLCLLNLLPFCQNWWAAYLAHWIPCTRFSQEAML